ncbi:uncharacterized protein LOC119976178 isoform X1 [Scyliorhinus canicula]|uniref:uncharacterized protein LOC119976178 isoform X1 n=2 Tax=Scyliorhinus canicula TaxID=7830 RepID=UPI0018F4A15F|nr:uncharacterized protein LOC119976178 isoform X1 [Scyliorhinus canicula]
MAEQQRLRERLDRQVLGALLRSYTKVLDKSDLQAALTERLQSEKCDLQPISPVLNGMQNEMLLQKGTQARVRQQDELMELHKSHRDLAQSMVELNRRLQHKDREILTNEAKMVEYHKRIKKLEVECRELHTNLQEMERANHALKNEYNTLHVTFSNLEERLQKMADENRHVITRWMSEKTQDASRLNTENEKDSRSFILLGGIGTLPVMPTNHKRTDLPLAEKVKVVAALQGPKASYASVAKMFSISKSQVGRISQNRERILEEWRQNANPNRKRKRKGKDIEVEDALLLWFQQAVADGVRVSGPMLKTKAKEFGEDLGHDDFEPTDGWLSRWKARNNIIFKKDSSERHDYDGPAACGRTPERGEVRTRVTDIGHNVNLLDAIQMLYRAYGNMEQTACVDPLHGAQLKKDVTCMGPRLPRDDLSSANSCPLLLPMKQEESPGLQLQSEDNCVTAKRPRLEDLVQAHMVGRVLPNTASAVTNNEALECVSKLGNWLQLQGPSGIYEPMLCMLRDIQTAVATSLR